MLKNIFKFRDQILKITVRAEWIMGLLCWSLFLCCLSVTNQVAFDDISRRWPGSVLVKEGSVGCEAEDQFWRWEFHCVISAEHNSCALKHKLLCTLNFTSLSLWTYHLWDAGTCGRSTKFSISSFSVVPHLNWNAKKTVNYIYLVTIVIYVCDIPENNI